MDQHAARQLGMNQSSFNLLSLCLPILPSACFNPYHSPSCHSHKYTLSLLLVSHFPVIQTWSHLLSQCKWLDPGKTRSLWNNAFTCIYLIILWDSGVQGGPEPCCCEVKVQNSFFNFIFFIIYFLNLVFLFGRIKPYQQTHCFGCSEKMIT